MKTRTLLLLALGCGLAILLAGGVLLVMLVGQDDPAPPVALGAETSIGDMRVIVLGATERDDDPDTLLAEIVLGGVDDRDGAAGFELIASGRPIPPGDASTCGTTTVEPRPCTLVFDVSTADGESRVLRYRRGDDQARWNLLAGGDDARSDDVGRDGTVNGDE
jgi:hypothetical protein